MKRKKTFFEAVPHSGKMNQDEGTSIRGKTGRSRASVRGTAVSP